MRMVDGIPMPVSAASQFIHHRRSIAVSHAESQRDSLHTHKILAQKPDIFHGFNEFSSGNSMLRHSINLVAGWKLAHKIFRMFPINCGSPSPLIGNANPDHSLCNAKKRNWPLERLVDRDKPCGAQAPLLSSTSGFGFANVPAGECRRNLVGCLTLVLTLTGVVGVGVRAHGP